MFLYFVVLPYSIFESLPSTRFAFSAHPITVQDFLCHRQLFSFHLQNSLPSSLAIRIQKSFLFLPFICSLLDVLLFRSYKNNAVNSVLKKNQISITAFCLDFFYQAADNNLLTEQFKTCVTSICKQTSINLKFHIVADRNSWEVAKKIFDQLVTECKQPFKLEYHSATRIAEKLKPTTDMLRVSYKTQL